MIYQAASSLMKRFCEVWPFREDVRPVFDVHDTGEHFRVFIRNKCSWMTSGGGCTVCNYSSRTGPTAGEVLADNMPAILRALPAARGYTVAQIYMNGSFFSDREIPAEMQSRFLRALHDTCGIRHVKVETRPEHVDRQRVEKILSETGLQLEIAIGVESCDESIRAECLNKGFTWSQFAGAFQSIKDICSVKAYLLFKPPFLTEGGAVADALSSIEKLAALGVTSVSLTPVAVQRDTLLEFLLQENLYRPPWLWSLVEVNTRAVAANITAYNGISGLYCYPEPIATAFNCDACSNGVIEKLKENPKLCWGDGLPDCLCAKEWREQYEAKPNQDVASSVQQAAQLLEASVDRSVKMRSLLGAPADVRMLTDPAKTCPRPATAVDRAGITGVSVQVHLGKEQFGSFLPDDVVREPYVSAFGECSAGARVREFHRGVHVSRIVRDVFSLQASVVTDLRNEVRLLCSRIAASQEEPSAFVDLSLHSELPQLAPRSELHSSVALTIHAQAELTKEAYVEDRLEVSWPIVNACPCTLELSRVLRGSEKTHLQRGRIAVSAAHNWLGIADLLTLASPDFLPKSFLRREDEIFVVEHCFDPPEFCEDICRRLCTTAKDRFHGSGGSIRISVKTDESIHSHAVFAVKTIGL